MPQYLTIDQHIKWKGEYIPPGTLVKVAKKDKEIWDQLVKKKVAVRVAEEQPAEEPPAEELPADTSPEA